MSAGTFSVELTPAEHELLKEIEFDALALPDDHKAVRRNGELAAQLMRLVIARDAPIPAYRLSYFTDPDYNIGGRGSSRQEIFERNGTPRLRRVSARPAVCQRKCDRLHRGVIARHLVGPVTAGSTRITQNPRDCAVLERERCRPAPRKSTSMS